MTTTTNQTALELFIADMDKAQTRSKADNAGVADIAAHLIAAIEATERDGSNLPKIVGTYDVTEGKGKERKTVTHEITFDRALLKTYAQGNMSADDKTRMFDALAGLSPKVQQARVELKELLNLPKAQQQLESVKAAIESARTEAHSVGQATLHRPLRLAAYVFTSKEGYDVTTAKAGMRHGKRVFLIDQRVKAGKLDTCETVSISDRALNAGLAKIAAAAGNEAKKRQTKVTTANVDTRTIEEPNTVKVTGETFRKGRKDTLAQTFDAISHGLADMPDAFKPTERKEAVTLILSLIDKLDAEAKADLLKELKAA